MSVHRYTYMRWRMCMCVHTHTLLFQDFPFSSSITEHVSTVCQWNPELVPVGHLCIITYLSLQLWGLSYKVNFMNQITCIFFNDYKHVGWKWGTLPRNTKHKQTLLLIFLQNCVREWHRSIILALGRQDFHRF